MQRIGTSVRRNRLLNTPPRERWVRPKCLGARKVQQSSEHSSTSFDTYRTYRPDK